MLQQKRIIQETSNFAPKAKTKLYAEFITNAEEIKTDSIMLENTRKVIAVLDDIKKSEIQEPQLIDILKIQKLVSEINSDDH